ncbi:MAG TPA: potassium channel family protein [Desulfuromonadaceae bacterium]
MAIAAACAGIILLAVVLWEAFETIVLPRRVTRRVRLTRIFYRLTWRPWLAVGRAIASGRRLETLLSFFGPMSLLLLLCLWAVGLIAGFALLFWACGSHLKTPGGGFLTDFYLSGTNLFTLGLGDATPGTSVARMLTVCEAGIGLAFLALVIGYLPALNQSFARREVSISLLDARAGSPPSAAEMLRRHGSEHGLAALQQLLRDWELWSAELLESHLSYPVLAYFRSQHDNQSWLASLTAILDTCALVMVGLEGACERQAELTFAMARHAVADLSLVFLTPPREPRHNRLPPDALAELRAVLAAAGLKLREGEEADEKLRTLRHMYEPYVFSLARYLSITIPPWIPVAARKDNWQASAWERGPGRTRGRAKNVAVEEEGGEHF